MRINPEKYGVIGAYWIIKLIDKIAKERGRYKQVLISELCIFA